MTNHYDDAVVGAGIMGLATAYALAKRGRRVVVFERDPQASSASVRNFGMLWPIGQPAGSAFDLAMSSRRIWLDVLASADIWHQQVGSLHLAYRDDEAAVLSEFLDQAPSAGFDCAWWDKSQVLRSSPTVNPEGLLGALWSSTEICVDPREVLRGLPAWLHRQYQVQFEFQSTVTSYDHPVVWAADREWRADRLFVCSGADFATLYPAAFAASGLYRVKLQMMRSQAFGNTIQLGPMLAAGLTLCHYKAFQHCPSLPQLRQRFAQELPEHVRYGIHVMASQNARGEITIGDSHQSDEEITPFDLPRIDELIMEYLRRFLSIPQLQIQSRWHGIYAGHPTELCWTHHPAPRVTILASPSGRGMTMSFGVTEQIVRETLGEHPNDLQNVGHASLAETRPAVAKE